MLEVSPFSLKGFLKSRCCFYYVFQKTPVSQSRFSAIFSLPTSNTSFSNTWLSLGQGKDSLYDIDHVDDFEPPSFSVRLCDGTGIAEGILTMGDDFQVGEEAALSVPAKVVEFHAFGDRFPGVEEVGDSVGVEGFVYEFEDAIACFVDRALELPAPGALSDFRPEPSSESSESCPLSVGTVFVWLGEQIL